MFTDRALEPGPNDLENIRCYTFRDQITRAVHIGGQFRVIWRTSGNRTKMTS